MIKVYYRTVDKIPFDNFCSDGAIGAREQGIQNVYAFEDIKSVPFDKHTIVITSVEESEQWLNKKVKPIDDSWAKEFKKRSIKYMPINQIISYPCFIKPSQEIKAFTGVIVNNYNEAMLFTQNYQKFVEVQDPIYDIESEYRVYVNKDRGILGVKHYLGDPYLKLDENFVSEVHLAAKKNLKENSYSLDFGIKENGENFLIEVNDGWAIGNYGLTPYDYYSFIKARWLQLTELLQ